MFKKKEERKEGHMGPFAPRSRRCLFLRKDLMWSLRVFRECSTMHITSTKICVQVWGSHYTNLSMEVGGVYPGMTCQPLVACHKIYTFTATITPIPSHTPSTEAWTSALYSGQVLVSELHLQPGSHQISQADLELGLLRTGIVDLYSQAGLMSPC